MGHNESKTEVSGGADISSTAELLPYPFQVLAPDGRIQLVNEAWLTALSADRTAALDTTFTNYLTAESATAFESALQSLREGSALEQELEVVVATDGRRTVTAALKGEYDEADELVRVHCQFADTIASGTRLEADQTRSFPQLKRAVEAAGHAVFITDADGVIEYVNPAFEEITGYAAAEAIGQNPRILKSGEMSPAFYEQLWTTICNGDVWQQEICNRRKDGELYHAHQTIAPVTTDDGAVEAFVAIQADISEQKQQRDRLQRSQERIRALFDKSPDSITVHDEEGNILDVNDQTVEDLGYTREELSSMHIADIEVGVSTQELQEMWQRMEPGDRETVEGRHRRKDGSTFPVDVWLNRLEFDGEEQFIALSRDITDRKRRERELERREFLFERIQDIADIGVWEYDPHTEDLIWSQGIRGIHGLSDEFEPTVEQALQFYHEDDRDTVRDIFEHAVEHGEWKRTLDVRIVRDSGEIRSTRLRGEVMTDTYGDPTRIRGILQDITEQKRHEQELESQRDDLEVLNQMMRHDIRNDLQLVQLHAELLSDHVGTDGKRYLESLLESVENAVSLTETARELAEVMLGAEDTEQRVSLALTLDKKLSELRNSFDTADIEVVGPIPAVEVIGTDMLGSVFRNILQNAIQHNTVSDPRVAILCEETDDTVVVSIADNGPGVPDDQKEEIFGKGEKGLGSDGTGIGLYLVHTLVEGYGGEVWVEDAERFDGLADTDVAEDDFDGAVFRVELRKAN